MAQRATGRSAKITQHIDKPLRLLADIGGTYVRFAVQKSGEPARKQRRYLCIDFPDIATAIRTYYRDARLTATRPSVAAFAVAAPITGDRVVLTNHPWKFSIAGLGRKLAFSDLVVVNDFLAISESIPCLKAGDRRKIGGGRAVPRATMAIIGPGTGLGVGALAPIEVGRQAKATWQAIASEGGHATLATSDPRELKVIERIRRIYPHVSIERCLSGQGLVNLHHALCEIAGVETPDIPPHTVTRHARQGDPMARETIAMFCALLGSAAGNLALTYGALGGVYIAGGIVPKLGPLFDSKLFIRRFTAKGRYRRYLSAIPVYVIIHPLPALIGLAALLDRRESR